MTSFEKRCELLERLWYYTESDERYDTLRAQHDITFPVLSWINKGLVTPSSDLVEKNVDYLWDKWLNMLGVEDTGNFETVLDIDSQLDMAKPFRDLYDIVGEPEDEED